MDGLILLPLFFVLMWLLFIRPQQKRVRQHQQLLGSLALGDEIVTVGGMVGIVRELGEERMTIEVAPNVEVRMLRAAISRKVPAAPLTDDTDLIADDDVLHPAVPEVGDGDADDRP